MRRYYHIYPTCPSCHAPHMYSSPIKKISEDIYLCTACETEFRGRLHVDSDRFPETKEMMGKYRDEYLPVVWGVDFNPIEGCYLQWISNASPGVYLITWPWKRVKFIPALVTEFILKGAHLDEPRILIFSDIEESQKDDTLYSPDIISTFTHMIHIDQFSDEWKNTHLKREWNRFDPRRMISVKRKLIRYRIKYKGKDIIYRSCPYLQISRCKKIIIKEFEEFTAHSIKKISVKKMKGKNPPTEIINEDGDVDITIEELEKYPDRVGYRGEWIWDVIYNSHKIERPFKDLSLGKEYKACFRNRKKSEILIKKRSDFIIFSEGSGSELDHYDMILIPYFDTLIEDYTINRGDIPTAVKKIIRNLLSIVERYNDTIILIFSTYPHIRSRYWKHIAEMGEVNLHTWDAPMIMEKIVGRVKTNHKVYPSLLSSTWATAGSLRGRDVILSAEFKEVSHQLNLSEAVKECVDKISSQTDRNYIRTYFHALERSPLSPIIHDDMDDIFFSVKDINYITVYNIMGENICDLEKIERIVKSMDVKIDDHIYVSPVGEMMLKIASEIINENPDSQIIFVVRGAERHGWKKIVDNVFGNSGRHFSVHTWSYLSKTSVSTPRSIIISSSIPYGTPNVYNLNAQRVIFVGYKGILEYMRKIWSEKMLSPMSHPVSAVKGEAPPLLIDILKEISLTPEDIEYAEIEMNVHMAMERDEYGDMKEKAIRETISPGDRAFLLILDGGELIVPLNRGIIVKETSGSLREIRLKINQFGRIRKELVGQRILIDPRGVYLSFRRLFIEYMMRYGENVIFGTSIYRWKGFRDLYMTSLLWIFLLLNAVQRCEERCNLSTREASDKIANLLVDAGITARNSAYIESWWRVRDIIYIDEYEIPIFGVEHPENIDDMRKIFRVLSENVYDGKEKIYIWGININMDKMEESYIASRYLQKLRRRIFKGKTDDLGYAVEGLIHDLRKHLSSLSDNVPVRVIKDVHLIEAVEEIDTFKSTQENKGKYKILK